MASHQLSKQLRCIYDNRIQSYDTFYATSWPWPLIFWYQIWVTWPDLVLKTFVYFEVHKPLYYWNTRPWSAYFLVLLLGNRRCHGNHLCLFGSGVVLLLTPRYEVIMTTQYWVTVQQILPVDLTWHCNLDLDLLILKLCHVMWRMWSTPVPSLKLIWLTVAKLARPQCYIDRQFNSHF